MKMYPEEAAFPAALRGGRAGASAAEGRSEEEGTVKGCVAVGGWGSEAVPAPQPAARD